ncbi:DUF4102 domain-containing protein [Paraburkholderia sp. Ac-20336]|uniref:Arm DNA-binding domain-containing protein n=1 Tax=Burkholderiaceae TaxID=119060 RepID=UPI001420D4AA|nr:MULTISPECIES: Arm DNA-binding domain-containing protein [Burkholderiaceae]MBN3806619.1 DUF4102 domain-containing protein [Paraburkholderia sp. Ac-20336]NIF52394.1 DUF4102 domain-containing protein [Burkholderia sp. Ax-1724]
MRTINRLTAATIKRLISNSPKKARYYLDGDGLNIQITPTGVASWVLKYQLHNRSRELGLGRWLRAPWQASGARIGTLPALRGLFFGLLRTHDCRTGPLAIRSEDGGASRSPLRRTVEERAARRRRSPEND